MQMFSFSCFFFLTCPCYCFLWFWLVDFLSTMFQSEDTLGKMMLHFHKDLCMCMVQFGMLHLGQQRKEELKPIIGTNHSSENITILKLLVAQLTRTPGADARPPALRLELVGWAASRWRPCYGCRGTIRCMIIVGTPGETILTLLSVSTIRKKKKSKLHKISYCKWI